MGVPCPGCGREYDATLFEFGHTLWCTCGQRVGMEPRERRLAGPGRRFIADAMLGKLARWLRILGFDCAWEPDIDDESLVRRAFLEGRIVLSRDRGLLEEWRISDVHRVRSERPRDQLAEIVAHLGLAPEIRLLSRCSRCNEPLEPAAPEAVNTRIPPGVRERQAALSSCPRCARVYWEGAHTRRIRRFVDELRSRTGERGPGPAPP